MEFNLKPGSKVVIGTTDISKIEMMQQNHGEWSPIMNECFIGPCKLIHSNGIVALVKAPSGNVYRLNAKLLVKYISAEKREIGAVVEIIDDEDLFRKMNCGIRTESIKDILGQQVEIVQQFEDGDCKVKYNNEIYMVNSKCIVSKATEITGNTFAEGDKVILMKNVDEVKKLQLDHGGWCDLMTFMLGEEVEIVRIFHDKDIVVSKFGMDWLMNPKCIEPKVINVKATSSKLKKGDIVEISKDIAQLKKLQKFHGGYVSAMKHCAGKTGIVENVLHKGIVKVNVNGMGFAYNTKLLTKISDADNRNERTVGKLFSTGDKVRLIRDKSKVKQLQKNHGEWVSGMELFLGKTGTVKSIFPDGDLRVKIMNQKLTLNPECVELENDSSDSEPDVMKIIEQMSKVLSPDIRKLIDSDNDSNKDSDNNADSDSDDNFGKDTNHEKVESSIDDKKKFILSVKRGDLTKVKNLVDQIGPNACDENMYPLLIATNNGHRDIVKLLIDKKADLNVRDGNGDTALHIAVQKNRCDICKILLNNGIDINSQNNKKVTAIMMATVKGSQDILRLLVNWNNADLHIGNSKNDTALHLAVKKSRVDSVETLLEAGADIKVINKKDFSSFHSAAFQGHEKILEMFLKKEGSSIIDMQKEDKFAAIHLAAINNHSGCLRILLHYNANIEILNHESKTALHLAVSQNYLDCVKLLVENKANINSKDEKGNTPLHEGIEAFKKETIKKMGSLIGLGSMIKLIKGSQKRADNPEDIILYLIENGAEIDIKNYEGKTPLECCEDDLLKAKMLSMLPENSEHIKHSKKLENLISTLDLQCGVKCNHKFCPLAIRRKQFGKGNIIGQGGFGKVYKCEVSQNKLEFAMKIIPNKYKNVDLELIEKNIDNCLSNLKHPRIIMYFSAIQLSNHLYIFMEYLSGGSIQDKISRKESMKIDIIIHFTKQILEGLAYLHDNKIIHRDIKPGNILLNKDQDVKLADFDFPRLLTKIDGLTQNATTFSGTAYFMAPEIINNEPYNYSADIWSLGVTIINMITGEPPYHGMILQAAMFKIANERKIPLPESLPNELKKFIESLLNGNPDERPTASVLLDSEIFKEVLLD